MRSWKEIRPDVVTDPDRVAARREQLDAEEHDQKVAEAARRVARISAGLNRRLAGE